MDRFTKALDKLNAELHQGAVRPIKAKLYYRSSKFPLRPGKTTTRYDFPLKVNATLAGLNHIANRAREIDLALALGKFEWKDYLNDENIPQNLGQWIAAFTSHHWEKIPYNVQTRETWRCGYQPFLNRLPKDEPLDVDILKAALLTYPAGTRSRLGASTCYCALARYAAIPDKELEELKHLGRGYKTSSLVPRNLPSDEEIGQWLTQLSQPWQWVYGMIAVYGLRPHEVFFVECDQTFGESPISVLKGKTGYRIAYPVAGKWETVNLSKLCLPKVNTERGHRALGQCISKAFTRYKIPFAPYDLRHAYARRCAGIPELDVAWTAESMGHSVQVHCQTYRQWIGRESRDKVWESMNGRGF